MTTFIKAWAETVTAKRYLILLFCLLLLPLMLFTGRAIPFDNTTERYFVTGDPALVNFEYLIDLFGDYEYLIVGVEHLPDDGDVLNVDALDAIGQITDFFDSHRFVTQVRSLTNYQYTHADGDDLSTDYLIDDLDALADDPELISEVRNTVRGEDLALGTLISRDLRHARITARVEYRNDTAAHKVALAQEFYQFIADQDLENGPYTLHYSGYPLLSERFETLVQQDMQLLIPVMGVLLFLMLFLSFRSPLAMVLPGLVIAVGVLGVNEIQSYLGAPHSTVDQALLPTMIIIGVGITVHVLVEFYHALQEKTGQPVRRAAGNPAFMETGILHRHYHFRGISGAIGYPNPADQGFRVTGGHRSTAAVPVCHDLVTRAVEFYLTGSGKVSWHRIQRSGHQSHQRHSGIHSTASQQHSAGGGWPVCCSPFMQFPGSRSIPTMSLNSNKPAKYARTFCTWTGFSGAS